MAFPDAETELSLWPDKQVCCPRGKRKCHITRWTIILLFRCSLLRNHTFHAAFAWFFFQLFENWALYPHSRWRFLIRIYRTLYKTSRSQVQLGATQWRHRFWYCLEFEKEIEITWQTAGAGVFTSGNITELLTYHANRRSVQYDRLTKTKQQYYMTKSQVKYNY